MTPTMLETDERLAQERVGTRQLPRHIRASKEKEEKNLRGRTLIVCLDGTGDKFDADNSSIVHLVSCFKKHDPAQLTYYQSGIGTYDGGGLSNGFNAAVDMAVGSGLGVHIRDAYRFLMQTYHDGDKICLFGFSRGAYTARCLAGMLHKVGLLPAHNSAQLPFAYEYYKDDTPTGWKLSTEFKRTFCTNVNVHFVGVFDSVASVGFIPRKLPLSSTPTNKSTYFRHAMALDEHRAKFKVCRFKTKDFDSPPGEWTTIAEEHDEIGISREAPRVQSNGDSVNGGADSSTRQTGKIRETNVLEVWFAGCHCDVGGGAVKNEVRYKLAQIPLRWMIRQCFECDTGIVFNSHRLAREGLDIHTLWPVYQKLERPTLEPPPSHAETSENCAIAPITHRSGVFESANEKGMEDLCNNTTLRGDDEKRSVSDRWLPEQVEDSFDAISPINDQLSKSKGWWFLEYCCPIKVRVQEGDSWVKKVRLNLGRYRPVQEHEPNLHWTVEHRMQAKETEQYKVRTRMDKHAKWRVVA